MGTNSRELTLRAQPVASAELKIGAHYFSVQFLDDSCLVPTMEPLVFIGHDLVENEQGLCYFQDAASYAIGLRYESDGDEAKLWTQPDHELNHIFEFNRAIDVLVACASRRDKQQSIPGD